MTDPLNERPLIGRPSGMYERASVGSRAPTFEQTDLPLAPARLVCGLANALQNLRNAAADSARSGAFTGNKGRALEQAIREADRVLTDGMIAAAVKTARRAVPEHG